VIVDAIEAEVRALGWGGGVVVDVPPGLIAWAIPTALRQILSNVVKNATEALEGRSGGVVTARARRDGQRVVVAIEDNGCGIDGVDLPHIGEPFLTTKAARGGTGLGLYVSSLLAEQMGAVLQIEPLVGRSGTRVTLTLRDRDARPPHGGREVSSEPEPDDGDGAPIRDSHA
jgi:signal transduction histidine kinase